MDCADRYSDSDFNFRSLDALTFEPEPRFEMNEICIEVQYPIVAVWREVFSGIFSTIGRMAALAKCCDFQTGKYRHEALAKQLGSEETDRCMRIAHELLWNGWIRGSLEQQQADIVSYSHDISASMEQMLSLWAENLPFAALIPISATPEQRALFASNLGLLFKLLENLFPCRPAENAIERHTNPATALDQVVCAIRQRYSDPTLSLKVLSQGLNLSERHLGRLLKEILGQSFRHYLRELRIREAAELLANTTEDVKMIAGKVGYGHQSHFGVDFRALMGWTPLEFRNQEWPNSKCQILDHQFGDCC